MIAVDTSVVVAAFASWHEGHSSAASVLARKPRIPAHALIESFSVLTRLPLPHRGPPEVVRQFLTEGAIYDALIAETAKHANATLLTRDRRALPTYERLGVRFELIG